jgi:5-methyltetrahydrofolate--homocysteine methyltransferase
VDSSAPDAPKNTTPAPAPVDFDLHLVESSLDDILPFINWDAFYHIWDINGKSPDVSKAKSELKADAEVLLSQNRLSFRAVFRIFPVKSYAETVEILGSDGSTLEKIVFPRRILRNSAVSLTDNLAGNDYLGMFALSAGFGAQEAADAFLKNNDEYSAMLIKTLAEALAEAFAEKLHCDIMQKHWNLKNIIRDRKDLFNSSISGLRMAPGYPSCPDHKLKQPIFRLLDVRRQIGIYLTESDMMIPAASICAFTFFPSERMSIRFIQ